MAAKERYTASAHQALKSALLHSHQTSAAESTLSPAAASLLRDTRAADPLSLRYRGDPTKKQDTDVSRQEKEEGEEESEKEKEASLAVTQTTQSLREEQDRITEQLLQHVVSLKRNVKGLNASIQNDTKVILFF